MEDARQESAPLRSFGTGYGRPRSWWCAGWLGQVYEKKIAPWSRRYLAGRLSVGIFLLVVMGGILGWRASTTWNSYQYVGMGFVMMVPVVISMWEIWRLVPVKSEAARRSLVAFSSLLIGVPVVVVYLIVDGNTALAAKRWIAVLVAVEFLILWGMAKWMCWKINWEMGYWGSFKGISLSNMLLGACVFWNVVIGLLMSIMYWWVFLMFVVVALYDSLAFGLGRYGKAQLSSFSPKKTQLGMLGGILITWLIALIFVLCLPEDTRYTLDIEDSKKWAVVIMVPCFLVAATIGDLYYSMHKRIWGRKDFSRVLGNHGGFWDRFDSHVFAYGLFGLVSLVWGIF